MRLPVARELRLLITLIVLPLVLGGALSLGVDVTTLPLVAPERLTAVFLRDGQTYFGHLDDNGAGGTVTLADVYYFQDARQSSTGLPLGLVKRGGEAHQPLDRMRINRDSVLVMERLTPNSPVAMAIAAQRALGGDGPGTLLDRRTVATAAEIGAQRLGLERDLARGYAKSLETLNKLRELVLPVTAQQAAAILAKATDDLRSVRRAALGATATALGYTQVEATAYIASTDPQLETAPAATVTPTLLAPALYAVVLRADQLEAQIVDAASKQLTQKP